MTREIDIQHVGGVEHVRIPIPDGGGVVVLQGRNGAGKTQALNAVAALGGDGKIVARDGAETGRVAGCGVAVTVSKSTRRRGELECVIGDGSALSDVIDPQIVDAARADAARIKALVAITGAEASREFLESVAGVTITEACWASLGKPADPADAIGTVKRWLQSQARLCEDDAAEARGQADAFAADAAGVVDVGVSVEAAELAMHDAIRREATVRSERDACNEARRRAEEANRKLEEAAQQGPLADEESLIAALEDDVAKVDSLREKIDAMQRLMEKTAAAAREKQASLDTLRSVKKQIAALRNAAEAATSPDKLVTDNHVLNAQAAVAEATERFSAAKRAKEADAKRQSAVAAQANADAWRSKAEVYRTAAEKVGGAFSQLLKSDVFSVSDDGRLYVERPNGKKELFSRLSEGEKYRLVIPLVVDKVGTGGLLPLGQHIWEGLDPNGRIELLSVAKHLGVTILTAEATGDETLVAREFNKEVHSHAGADAA